MIEAFGNALANCLEVFMNMINFFIERPVLIPALPLAGVILGSAIGIIKRKTMPR